MSYVKLNRLERTPINKFYNTAFRGTTGKILHHISFYHEYKTLRITDTIAELGEALGISRSMVHRAFQKLEKEHYVNTHRDNNRLTYYLNPSHPLFSMISDGYENEHNKGHYKGQDSPVNEPVAEDIETKSEQVEGQQEGHTSINNNKNNNNITTTDPLQESFYTPKQIKDFDDFMSIYPNINNYNKARVEFYKLVDNSGDESMIIKLKDCASRYKESIKHKKDGLKYAYGAVKFLQGEYRPYLKEQTPLKKDSADVTDIINLHNELVKNTGYHGRVINTVNHRLYHTLQDLLSNGEQVIGRGRFITAYLSHSDKLEESDLVTHTPKQVFANQPIVIK